MSPIPCGGGLTNVAQLAGQAGTLSKPRQSVLLASQKAHHMSTTRGASRQNVAAE